MIDFYYKTLKIAISKYLFAKFLVTFADDGMNVDVLSGLKARRFLLSFRSLAGWRFIGYWSTPIAPLGPRRCWWLKLPSTSIFYLVTARPRIIIYLLLRFAKRSCLAPQLRHSYSLTERSILPAAETIVWGYFGCWIPETNYSEITIIFVAFPFRSVLNFLQP